jgi:hypothetical protein
VKKSLFLALTCPVFLFFQKINAQNCPISVDAGPNIHYCQGDPNANLNGSISGDFINFVWSPAAGLSSTTVLDPAVTIANGVKTYVLTGSGLTPNLLQNGDFEAGNTSFTSIYVYSATNLVPEGVYTVTDNPMSVHPGFAPCGDHTSGSGQMMVVNGSGTSGAVVYAQTVPVLPNMAYTFSYWGCTVVGSSPAQQIFRINGVNVGTQLNYPSTTCVWVKFSVNWNSGASSSANLQLINLNTSLGGNDYAIDDINFQKQCTDTDTVQVFYHPDVLKTVSANICAGDFYSVGGEDFEATGNYLINLETSFGCDSVVQLQLNVVTIDAEINPNSPQIDCSTPNVVLSSQNSTTIPGTQFQWTTVGGQIIGNQFAPQITAGGIGLYKLILKYQNAFLTCTDTATVQVTSSAQLPIAEAGNSASIGCATPTATLSGSFSGIPNGQPTWTTPNGHFVNGQNTLTPLVDAAGTYILTITNPQNGCTDTDTTFVTQDLSLPIAFAGASDTLNCLEKTLVLNGNGSMGANFTFNWTTPNGHFVSGQNTFTPIIDVAGQYILTVSNTQNGCSAISSASIFLDTLSPNLSLSAPFSLDCLVKMDTIFGQTSSSFPPVWTTIGGHFFSGQNTFSPIIDAAGIYILSLENTQNHCKTSKSVQISQNIIPPIVDAGPPKLLTCNQTSAILNGSANNTGANPSILWTTNGSPILPNSTILMPTISAPNLYFLSILNVENGCFSTDSVLVSSDPNIPIFSIAEPDTLSCVAASQMLNAAPISNFSINWMTTNGNILSGQTAANCEINAPGIYSAILTNPANGCSAVQSVEIFENKQLPIAAATVLEKITCLKSAVFIDGNGSSTGSQFQYFWTTINGQIIAGQNSLMPIIGSAGNYSLLVTDVLSGCTASKSVQVLADLMPPIALAGAGATLGCSTPTVVLDGSASSFGVNFTYFWSILTGNQPNPNNLPKITVNQSGIYFLEITNQNNGCTAIDSLTVFENTDTPIAQISMPEKLTCAQTSIILTAINSSVGTNFNYSWTTQNGNFLTQINNDSVTINKAGDYVLTILNTQNGCSKTAMTTVLEDKIPPNCEAGPNQMLNCGTISLTIIAQISAGSAPLWTTQNGHFLNGNASFSAQIDAAGTYFLTATNPVNGCTAVDSLQILPDAGAPFLNISPPNLLTCTTTQIQLSATVSAASGNTNFQISWTTLDGQIIADNNTLSPTINKKGIYLLTVKDLQNNCLSSQTIFVNQDTISPTILIQIPEKLTCLKTSILLSATVNSVGNDYNFQWNTNNGQFLQNQNSLNPTVNKIGNYQLISTDISNGCSSQKTVEILENKALPNVLINNPEILNCVKTTINLTGIFNQNNAFIWTTNGGNFTQNQNSAQPTVDKMGTYFLEITDFLSGCKARDTVQVLQNITAPTISILTPDTISCKKTNVEIVGIASGQSTISANWTTTNGNFLGNTNQLLVNVNSIGNYNLKITDSANGCTAIGQISVFENKSFPQIFIQNIKDLTCKDSIITLSTNNSSVGEPFDWDWNIPFSDTLNPEIMIAGQYKLAIIDRKNGCKTEQIFTIFENKVAPFALAGDDKTLNCLDTVVQIGNQISTPNLTFFWNTFDGKILGNYNLPNIKTDQIGTYFLRTTDIQNGCTAIDFVEVFEVKLTAAELEIQSPACQNQRGTIVVKMPVGGTLPYLFTINNGQNWQNSPVFNNLLAGEYAVAVADAGGCRLDFSAKIEAGKDLKISLAPEAEISLGDVWYLSAAINVPESQLAKIEWTPAESLSCADCLATVASPLSTTNYRLFVADTSGCEDEVFFKLKVTRPSIYAPNAIKFDAQSIDNQSFTLFSDAQAVREIRKMMVFDRWGTALFDHKNFPVNDPSQGWFGGFRGKKMQPGVYIWWAEVEWIDGKTTFLKGDLTVFE